jgi:hypothetical protein
MFGAVLVVGVVLTVAGYFVASRLEKNPAVVAQRARQRAMLSRGWTGWGLLLGVIFVATAVFSVIVVLAGSTFGVFAALVAVIVLSYPVASVIARADARLQRRFARR